MRIIKIIIIITVPFLILAQSQMTPSVTDNGGGIAQNSSYKLLSSIGQSVTGLRIDGTVLEAGYITAELDLTGIEEQNAKHPEKPIIGEFSPNPFNSATTIEINIPARGNILFQIFDLSGKQIYNWSEDKNAGIYKITFNANEKLPSGTYLYKITALNTEKNGKIAFVK